MPEHKILIVDDEKINIDILMNTLKKDYRIVVAKNGEQALEKIASDNIDLILLDIVMPGLSGYDVCKRIKSNSKSADIPVIFITAISDEINESEGLYIGAIDYIIKPFSLAIVKARVKNHVKLLDAMKQLEHLNKLALDANPNTRLPGNNTVIKEIKRVLDLDLPVAVIYADLDNFKAYNDKYGFAKGDEVIIFTAEILKDSLDDENCDSSFLGHIGGDDFVAIIPEDKLNSVTGRVTKLFDSRIKNFYSKEDASKGFISTISRDGTLTDFPIISISLGCIKLSGRKFEGYIDVSDACTEAKKMAKHAPGSSVFIERRSNNNASF
jgi:diguanylate cyclase (GGDEF)-like protein